MLFNTRCNINMFFNKINKSTCHLIYFDEQCLFRQVGSHGHYTWRCEFGTHAKSSMGGAGMRNTKARGAVDGLVRTETILMKRLPRGKGQASKCAKTPAVGGKAAKVATDHPTNENGWLVPLQTAMKGAPGVFTHIFDAYVLVTHEQLAVKYGLGMMDYQQTEKSDPINWIALFDFDRVDVDRIATLTGVKQKAL